MKTKKLLNSAILFLIMFLMLPFNGIAQKIDPYELTLEQLGQIQIVGAATLIPVALRDQPASVTVLNSSQISNSGARSLDELLEIYVPGLLSVSHPSVVGRYLGIRGIISTDVVLILVNGRVMNNRMFTGAHSERNLSMLGDIESIEFVRGPRSAIHGAGALSGVINIMTFSGNSFEGTDIAVRKGFLEDFVNIEFRTGHKFNPSNALFLYYGIDSYEGRDPEDSPFTFGSTRSGHNAGDRLTDGAVPVNQSFKDQERHKLYAQWDIGDFKVWGRYLEGGNNMTTYSDYVGRLTEGGDGYDHLTLMVTYSKDVIPNLKLTTKLSYDDLDYVQNRDDNPNRPPGEPTTLYYEEEYLAGIGANWTPHENHKLYLGYDYSRQNLDDPYGGKHWSIGMHSLISEYQWYMSDRFTFIGGSRFEKHSSIDHMLNSPRAALIFRQNNDRTFKLLYNHSIRRSAEEKLAKYEEQDTEDIDYYELIYHQLINENLSFQLSAYYALHNLISFSATTNSSRPMGQTEFTGFELECHYVTDKLRTQLSLSYCKLLNLHLDDPTDNVHLIYIANDKLGTLVNTFDSIEGKSILLVSDGYDDKRIVMINVFETEDKTMQFEINKANIINQGLTVLPDMVLLGGTEIDVAEIYRESQQSLHGLQKHFSNCKMPIKSLKPFLILYRMTCVHRCVQSVGFHKSFQMNTKIN